MLHFSYVQISTIKDYTYKKPLLSKDCNEKLISEYRGNNNGVLIKKMPLLNIVKYDRAGCLVDYQPLNVVNEFLLSKAIEDYVLELGVTAQGLAHYFTFILDKQAQWDEDYNESDIDELYDEPRPSWLNFPRNKQGRLTYQYREGLRSLVKQGILAATTAKQYLASVINFYRYWLKKGFIFNNPPFDYELVTVYFEAQASSIQAYQRKDFHTTDLRLKFSKPSKSYGTALDNLRRDLRPFSCPEWEILQDILMKSRRVVRHGDDKKLHSLPIEFCLHPMICRYTGMRREEAASLHLEQIVNPETIICDGKEVFKSSILKIGIGDRYGSLTKTPYRGNKSRVTVIPAFLMRILYEYSQSERYQKRLAAFKKWCEQEITQGNTDLFEGDDAVNPSLNYLFITQTGKPMFRRLNDFTMRWGEVRNTANLLASLDKRIVGSLHNLRPTFAISLFRHLLNKVDENGIPVISPDKALDMVSSLLGHEERATTLLYLKIAQDMPSSDEIYEDVLDYIGAFHDDEVHHEC